MIQQLNQQATMNIKLSSLFLSVLFSVSILTGCSKEDKVSAQTDPIFNMNGFAQGADVSWLTEMESDGSKFYTTDGKEIDCLELLRSMGVNAIRLRVWVNPKDGWNGKDDVLAKAWRAKNLGFRLMIDFHFSDSWADPGKQTIPAQWEGFTLKEMRQAVTNHTTTILQALKNLDIPVEWVQIGNETATGMLWEVGRYSDKDKTSFAQLINAGYEATKEVYPETKVIVHVDQGNNLNRFTWLFDGLKANGAKWDVIGMSLYPTDDDWMSVTTDCLKNVNTLMQRYGCEVIICEVGMPWDASRSKAFMDKIVTGARAINGCLGVFYWEPECYNDWKGYTKGAFDNSGRPTTTLDIFNEK